MPASPSLNVCGGIEIQLHTHSKQLLGPNNNHQVYTNKDHLTGTILVNLLKPLDITSIDLVFDGLIKLNKNILTAGDIHRIVYIKQNLWSSALDIHQQRAGHFTNHNNGRRILSWQPEFLERLKQQAEFISTNSTIENGALFVPAHTYYFPFDIEIPTKNIDHKNNSKLSNNYGFNQVNKTVYDYKFNDLQNPKSNTNSTAVQDLLSQLPPSFNCSKIGSIAYKLKVFVRGGPELKIKYTEVKKINFVPRQPKFLFKDSIYSIFDDDNKNNDNIMYEDPVCVRTENIYCISEQLLSKIASTNKEKDTAQIPKTFTSTHLEMESNIREVHVSKTQPKHNKLVSLLGKKRQKRQEFSYTPGFSNVYEKPLVNPSTTESSPGSIGIHSDNPSTLGSLMFGSSSSSSANLISGGQRLFNFKKIKLIPTEVECIKHYSTSPLYLQLEFPDKFCSMVRGEPVIFNLYLVTKVNPSQIYSWAGEKISSVGINDLSLDLVSVTTPMPMIYHRATTTTTVQVAAEVNESSSFMMGYRNYNVKESHLQNLVKTRGKWEIELDESNFEKSVEANGEIFYKKRIDYQKFPHFTICKSKNLQQELTKIQKNEYIDDPDKLTFPLNVPPSFTTAFISRKYKLLVSCSILLFLGFNSNASKPKFVKLFSDVLVVTELPPLSEQVDSLDAQDDDNLSEDSSTSIIPHYVPREGRQGKSHILLNAVHQLFNEHDLSPPGSPLEAWLDMNNSPEMATNIKPENAIFNEAENDNLIWQQSSLHALNNISNSIINTRSRSIIDTASSESSIPTSSTFRTRFCTISSSLPPNSKADMCINSNHNIKLKANTSVNTNTVDIYRKSNSNKGQYHNDRISALYKNSSAIMGPGNDNLNKSQYEEYTQ